MKRYHTIIVGGGPAGMAAALQCAKEEQKALLIDHCDKIGKKILVTGNGKCNLTNLKQYSSCYRSDAPNSVGSIFLEYGLEKTLRMFHELGIYTKDRDGYVYPYHEQAAGVREAFEAALKNNGNLDILTKKTVADVQKKEEEFLVTVCDYEDEWERCGQKSKDVSGQKNGEDRRKKSGRQKQRVKIPENRKVYRCRSLIIATGGLAGVKLGCDGSGYRLAKKLGHHMIRPLPALTALKSGAPFLKKLSGVRNQAHITLCVKDTSEKRDQIYGENVAKNHREPEKKQRGVLSDCHGRSEQEWQTAEETGELQWTDYGISGVAVFQLSRFAITALEEGKAVRLLLDFMPECSREETVKLFSDMIKTCAFKEGKIFLNGFFPAKLSPVLLREARIEEEERVGDWQREQIEALVDVIKGFSLNISGYMGFEKAQVTRGGVDMRELGDHLESGYCPGLFFAGEVLDVDGTCGGYNLQWAFSSGSVAGKASFARNRK